MAGLGWAVWWVPEELVKWSLRPSEVGAANGIDQLSADERATVTTNARQGMLWAAGGVIAIISLVMTWLRHRMDRGRQDLDKDGNRTERYMDAVKQLGDDSLTIRLGSIFALERLAQDSVRDQRAILDVLCSFVRESSPVPVPDGSARASVGTDVAAAVTVFGRRSFLTGQQIPFDLSRANLDQSNLSNANLAYANFNFSSLSEAQLTGATMNHATFLNANLTRANLSGATLKSANLIRINLTLAAALKADFSLADFSEANLNMAHLAHSRLQKASLTMARMVQVNLTGSDLSGATLNGADLTNAFMQGSNLANANLSDAILAGADLRDARLTEADLTGTSFIGADLTGTFLNGPRKTTVLVTAEYLESQGALHVDSAIGLPVLH